MYDVSMCLPVLGGLICSLDPRLYFKYDCETAKLTFIQGPPPRLPQPPTTTGISGSVSGIEIIIE